MSGRSNRAEVRNPVLTLPAAKRFPLLSPEARREILAWLADLRDDASARGTAAWAKRKWYTAAYWKGVSVYAGHFYKALRRSEQAELTLIAEAA